MDLPGIDSYVAEYRWLSANGIFFAQIWRCTAAATRCSLPVGTGLVSENGGGQAVPGGGFKLSCCGARLQPEKRSSTSPESLGIHQSLRSADALN